MAVSLTESAFVVTGGETVSVGAMFSATPSSLSPTYLILSGVDINEYPASASQITGTLTGANGAVVPFFAVTGDATQRGVEAVFTYQASTGRYYSSAYGYFDQMTYTASASTEDLMSLSVFTTNDRSIATTPHFDPASLAATVPQDFIGSATLYTDKSFSGLVPSVATPASLAAVGASFIGKIWNDNGCWGEAAAIAAEAGVGLPVAAGFTGLPGQKMGEWAVVFDGISGQTGNWQSMVRQGDVVGLVDSDGVTGHITTCVAGAGSTALLVDDAYFTDANNNIVNAANDGNSNDIIVTPLLAPGEFTGVATSSVVIYRLDTPIISDLLPYAAVAAGGTLALTTLFSASSPDGHAIASWQIYDANSADSLSVNGAVAVAHLAGNAVSVSSLSGVSLQAGSGSMMDSIEVRAYNGSYWGDWQSVNVYIGGDAVPTAQSSDLAITDFIAGQNEANRGANGVALLNNGMVANGDSVIGEMTATLGNGVNAVVLNDDITAYSWNIDATGVLHLFDGDTGRNYTISGATDVVFDGAVQDSSGNFAGLLLVLNGPDSEVARFYEAALGRIPDLAGMEYYINQVAGGLSVNTIANDFFASPEFTARFGAMASLSDGAYIDLLYQNVLGRTPAAGELSFYQSALSGGESRLTLFLDFSSSQEFINQLNATNGGWLVDTALGGTATSDDRLIASTVISQAVTNNYLDTNLISPSSLAKGQSYSAGGITITSEGADFSIAVTAATSGFTLLMAPANNAATIAVSGATIDGGSAGGDSITITGTATTNDVLILAGGGNHVIFAANNTGTISIAGFSPGSDHIDLTAFKFGSYAALAADSTISGSQLQIHNGPSITLNGVSNFVAGDFLL